MGKTGPIIPVEDMATHIPIVKLSALKSTEIVQ